MKSNYKENIKMNSEIERKYKDGLENAKLLGMKTAVLALSTVIFNIIEDGKKTDVEKLNEIRKYCKKESDFKI